MYFEKLSNNSRLILSEINDSTNPVQILCQKFESYTNDQKDELRSILRELSNKNYIRVQWANNIPYHVIITNLGRSYEEQLLDHENELSKINSVTINIGNNNKFKNSSIPINNSMEFNDTKGFHKKHPWIHSFLISILVGIILMFSFWGKIINFIETIFLENI